MLSGCGENGCSGAKLLSVPSREHLSVPNGCAHRSGGVWWCTRGISMHCAGARNLGARCLIQRTKVHAGVMYVRSVRADIA
jgi:UDP-N-acetylglucosamine enolpyruvyl transferase